MFDQGLLALIAVGWIIVGIGGLFEVCHRRGAAAFCMLLATTYFSLLVYRGQLPADVRNAASAAGPVVFVGHPLGETFHADADCMIFQSESEALNAGREPCPECVSAAAPSLRLRPAHLTQTPSPDRRVAESNGAP